MQQHCDLYDLELLHDKAHHAVRRPFTQTNDYRLVCISIKVRLNLFRACREKSRFPKNHVGKPCLTGYFFLPH